MPAATRRNREASSAMDVIILCGGKGTRLSEETVTRPKPMVEIGGMPILWHIMKTYSHFGYKRFILSLGYMSGYIKEYFYNLRITSNDFVLTLNPNHEPRFLNDFGDDEWEIVFVNTGEETLKGARIKRVEEFVRSDRVHVTYGDGVSDVDLDALVRFHETHGAIGTVTGVRPPSRFGELTLEDDMVLEFEEKPQMHTGYINGGFFVFDRAFFDYLSPEPDCDLEFGPLQRLARDRQLRGFKHERFWQCMDNVREKTYLDRLVRDNQAPWMKWNR